MNKRIFAREINDKELWQEMLTGLRSFTPCMMTVMEIYEVKDLLYEFKMPFQVHSIGLKIGNDEIGEKARAFFYKAIKEYLMRKWKIMQLHKDENKTVDKIISYVEKESEGGIEQIIDGMVTEHMEENSHEGIAFMQKIHDLENLNRSVN